MASYEERVAAHLWTETDAGQSVIDRLIDRHIAIVEKNRKAGVSAKRTATQLWSKHARSSRDAVRAIEGWEITYYEPRHGNRTFTVATHAKLKDAESWLNDGGFTYHVRQIPKGTAARVHREAFMGGVHRAKRAKRDETARDASKSPLIRQIYGAAPKDFRYRTKAGHHVMLPERSGHGMSVTLLERLPTSELRRIVEKYQGTTASRDRSRRRRSGHTFYVVKTMHGPSAYLIDSRGRSINAINGDRSDTVKSILAAARREWPNAREVSPP